MDDSTGAAGETQRSENSNVGKISTAVTNCLDLFRRLLGLEQLAKEPDKQSIKAAIQDEETRFKVWSGNIGAHKTGRSSLDYRLRDASHLQNQVLRLLDDLSQLHGDAIAIVRGEKVPWDKTWPNIDSIAEVVNCLLRLSVSIRNPAPHDRLAASSKTDTSHYEPFDTQHVKSKFGKTIADGLAVRLGKAISRRRQYFRYRESHRAKLSHGLEGNDKDGEHESTVASSIPHHLKDLNAPKPQVVDEDTRSATCMTETSFASSAPGTAKLRLPPLPREAEKGPFECPFCFMMISATNPVSWRRHVYGDLRPYVCLSEDCQVAEQEFTRRDWMQHELQNHWKTYTCPLGCDDRAVFRSTASLKRHLHTKHKTPMPTGSALDAMVDLQAQPVRIEDGVACQLCGEGLFSVQSYRRHVGRHQEQLSLFALPNISQGDEDEGTDGESSAHTDDGNPTGTRNIDVELDRNQPDGDQTMHGVRREKNSIWVSASAITRTSRASTDSEEYIPIQVKGKAVLEGTFIIEELSDFVSEEETATTIRPIPQSQSISGSSRRRLPPHPPNEADSDVWSLPSRHPTPTPFGDTSDSASSISDRQQDGNDIPETVGRRGLFTFGQIRSVSPSIEEPPTGHDSADPALATLASRDIIPPDSLPIHATNPETTASRSHSNVDENTRAAKHNFDSTKDPVIDPTRLVFDTERMSDVSIDETAGPGEFRTGSMSNFPAVEDFSGEITRGSDNRQILPKTDEELGDNFPEMRQAVHSPDSFRESERGDHIAGLSTQAGRGATGLRSLRTVTDPYSEHKQERKREQERLERELEVLQQEQIKSEREQERKQNLIQRLKVQNLMIQEMLERGNPDKLSEINEELRAVRREIDKYEEREGKERDS